MKTATLRLFKAIQVERKLERGSANAVCEKTINKGYIIDPSIEVDDELQAMIEDVVLVSGEKANAAFHKSWSVVRNSSMEELVMQQILHYFTTYGFEARGFYSADAVYVPRELLQLPALSSDIPIIIIKAMTAQEIRMAIVKLGSGIALSASTIDDIMTIVKGNRFDSALAEEIFNRELKAVLNDYFDLAPSQPLEFLRYVISKLTDESLLIKNDELIGKIKQANGKFLDMLLKQAPEDLASIFYRFKPLFLALKSISGNKRFFNRLRKQAVKLHKPLPEDYLNSVTAQLKRGALDLAVLEQRLAKVSAFRKVRLAYALNHRLHAGDSIVYRVRNGRGWATEFNWSASLRKNTRQALDVVVASLAGDVRKNVEAKTIYIPKDVYYALPATEKQFTGNLPSGSSVKVAHNLVVGVHWQNTDKRVDLDLSVIGESGKYGWDAAYRSQDNEILFSGDMTDAPAPHGASELFYIKAGIDESRILMLNYFNQQKGDEVTAKLLVAHEKPGKFNRNHMVDVSNIIASANISVTRKQCILGLIANVHGKNRVFFANINLGNSITASQNAHSTHARKYLVESTLNAIDLRYILRKAGAIVVDEKVDYMHIDLSPETLNKSTIMELLGPAQSLVA